MVSISQGLWSLAATLFCLMWGASVLAFPAYKELLSGYIPVLVGVALGLIARAPSVRGALTKWVMAPDETSFIVGTMIAGALLRLLIVAVVPMEPTSDHLVFHYSAVSLAGGQGYGNTAFFPPGMALLLTPFYWLFGPSPILGKLLNIGFGLATIPLVLDLGKRTISHAAGRWAALLAALFPTLVVYAASLGYEIALGFLLLAVCALNIRIVAGARSGPWLALLIGALLGFGSLLKPICLLIPLILFFDWFLAGLRIAALRSAVLVVVAMAVVIAPWTLRNYRVLGSPVLVSTNGGVVLYMANNSNTDNLHMDVGPIPDGPAQVAFNEAYQRRALDWIVANPGQWARNAATKLVYNWGTSSSIMSFISDDRMPPGLENAFKASLNVGWTALLVLVTFGVRRPRVLVNRDLWVPLLIVGYVVAIQLFFTAISRHHIPIIGILLLLAGAALAADEEGGRAQASVR
ncbi:MAG: glycosyltransferase family 39 protein [Vicinamibacterales bacterium]